MEFNHNHTADCCGCKNKAAAYTLIIYMKGSKKISSLQPRVVKELKVHHGLVSGGDGADNGPVIKASQEKRTRH